MATKALLVGINAYPAQENRLQGCVNDVTNMRNILKSYCGLSNEDIRVLVDDRATKAAILDRLTLMVNNASPGDYLIFHYSGHGSQIRDRDNDELADHLDELICPVDMDWNAKTYILDDDLRKIFDALGKKSARLEVFLDCCHSFTGTKGGFAPPADLEAAPVTRTRFMPPPVDIRCRAEGDVLPRTGVLSSLPPTEVCWAACLDYQTSADAFINGDYNGAFTYNLCKIIRESNGLIRRGDLLQRVRNSLSYNNFAQIPQLESTPEMEQAQIFSR